MGINIKALERAFDLERYLKGKDSDLKEYPPNLVLTDSVCGKAEKLWVLAEDRATGVKRGAWQCFYCGEYGRSVLSLIRRVEDCDLFHAMQVLVDGQKDGVDLADLRDLVTRTLAGLAEDLDVEWTAPVVLPMSLPDEFRSYNEIGRRPTYFRTRGITPERALRYHLGYCETGPYANRLIVPVRFRGKIVFFVARYMQPKPPDGIKKVLYPKGSHPNQVLFNYDEAVGHERIILVEDVFSAMSLGSNAVATFGTQLSQYQLELLLSSGAKEIDLLWDRDAIDKARALAVRLADFWTVRVVELPDARDPDEHDRHTIRRLIDATPPVDAAGVFRDAVSDRLSHL